MRNTTYVGDCLSVLQAIPDSSIHCCVTSPPYWGLRDYGVEGQLGLEKTPEEYVEKLTAVFQEVRRVLRDDGVLWLNLGDSYANDGKWGGSTSGKHVGALHGSTGVGRSKRFTGLKPKDLVGIPWMVAFSLRSDGWYLRSDVIWNKANPMPEPVADRPTRAHEYVFLLSKSSNYFYDADAIREPHADDWHERASTWRNGEAKRQLQDSMYHPYTEAKPFSNPPNPLGRNKRTVWSINPKPFKGAHFAVMPEELVRTCILAGTSEKGCCPACGAPWVRVLEEQSKQGNAPASGGPKAKLSQELREQGGIGRLDGGRRSVEGSTFNNPAKRPAPPATLGWQPSCGCPEHKPTPCLVLDPFAGSGTTLAVSKWLGRDYVGVELNPEYRPLIDQRLEPALGHQSEVEAFDLMESLPQED